MISEWMIVVYGVAGGIAALLFPKLLLCCCGFTCCGVRKHSLASRVHSGIGDVEAGGPFARSQSSGAAGFPWYIDLMIFLFGFTTTVVIVMVESMGGFLPDLKNVTSEGNFTTTGSMYLLNATTVLPLVE